MTTNQDYYTGDGSFMENNEDVEMLTYLPQYSEASELLKGKVENKERMLKIFLENRYQHPYDIVQRILEGRNLLLKAGIVPKTKAYNLAIEILYLRERIIANAIALYDLIQSSLDISPFIVHYLIFRFKLLILRIFLLLKSFKEICQKIGKIVYLRIEDNIKTLKNPSNFLHFLKSFENFQKQKTIYLLWIKKRLESFLINFRFSKSFFKTLKRKVICLTPYVIPFLVLGEQIRGTLKALGYQEILKSVPVGFINLPLIREFLFLINSCLVKNTQINLALFILYIGIFHSASKTGIKRYVTFPKDFMDHGRTATFFFNLSIFITQIYFILPFIGKLIVLVSDVFILGLHYLRKKTGMVLFEKVFRTLSSRSADKTILPGKYELWIARVYQEQFTWICYYIYLPFCIILLSGLVYNCCYYIIYNKKPYIPIVSDLEKKITPEM